VGAFVLDLEEGQSTEMNQVLLAHHFGDASSATTTTDSRALFGIDGEQMDSGDAIVKLAERHAWPRVVQLTNANGKLLWRKRPGHTQHLLSFVDTSAAYWPAHREALHAAADTLNGQAIFIWVDAASPSTRYACAEFGVDVAALGAAPALRLATSGDGASQKFELKRAAAADKVAAKDDIVSFVKEWAEDELTAMTVEELAAHPAQVGGREGGR
jgi:hypothetical protein